jgi:hypothetical protein
MWDSGIAGRFLEKALSGNSTGCRDPSMLEYDQGIRNNIRCFL